MRHLGFAALVLASLSCACVPAGQAPAQQPQGPVVPEESKAQVRKGDESMVAAQKQMDAEIDKNQADVEKAMKAALGQEAAYPGGNPPKPAADAINDIKKAKIKLEITPVLDAQGKPVAGQFVQLQDSYSQKVQKIGPKIASKKATPAEMKFVQNGVKFVPEINDLKGQVRAATMPAMQSGWMVTTGSMTTMSTVASMIRSRRQMEMKWTDKDYELVRQVMERQSRRTAVAALDLAMLGAYQAVVNHGADPKIITDVAKAGLAALPLKGEASIEDAKKYVDNFDQNVAASKQMYEQQMRKTFGDAEYEAKYKPQIDSTFAQAASATKAKSVDELMADTKKQYEADLQTCAAGKEPPPASMVGPDACKAAKAAAGPDGKLSPDALQNLVSGAVNKEVEKAQGFLGNLMDAIPGVAQVKMAIEGVAALKDGDPAKALEIASRLVPIPGVSTALASASKVAAAVQKGVKTANNVKNSMR